MKNNKLEVLREELALDHSLDAYTGTANYVMYIDTCIESELKCSSIVSGNSNSGDSIIFSKTPSPCYMHVDRSVNDEGVDFNLMVDHRILDGEIPQEMYHKCYDQVASFIEMYKEDYGVNVQLRVTPAYTARFTFKTGGTEILTTNKNVLA